MPGLHLHAYTVHLHLCTDTRPYINAQVYTHIHTHMHTSTLWLCAHTHTYSQPGVGTCHMHTYTQILLWNLPANYNEGLKALMFPKFKAKALYLGKQVPSVVKSMPSIMKSSLKLLFIELVLSPKTSGTFSHSRLTNRPWGRYYYFHLHFPRGNWGSGSWNCLLRVTQLASGSFLPLLKAFLCSPQIHLSSPHTRSWWIQKPVSPVHTETRIGLVQILCYLSV